MSLDPEVWGRIFFQSIGIAIHKPQHDTGTYKIRVRKVFLIIQDIVSKQIFCFKRNHIQALTNTEAKS
jgi:hypothetical protein